MYRLCLLLLMLLLQKNGTQEEWVRDKINSPLQLVEYEREGVGRIRGKLIVEAVEVRSMKGRWRWLLINLDTREQKILRLLTSCTFYFNKKVIFPRPVHHKTFLLSLDWKWGRVERQSIVWEPVSESGRNVIPAHRAFFNPSTRDSSFQLSN
jgi:hypothetical protein